MRILLLILLGFPFFSNAQINRSANELAREKVKEYIVTKIFKELSYKPISYGELKPQKQPHSEMAWSIIHRFEIVDSQFVSDKKIPVTKPYDFSFTLDKKLNVIAAENFHRE
ncbi:MAG: hypothetical protein ABI675_00795 [Chitinophagaceae bacterium]